MQVELFMLRLQVVVMPDLFPLPENSRVEHPMISSQTRTHRPQRHAFGRVSDDGRTAQVFVLVNSFAAVLPFSDVKFISQILQAHSDSCARNRGSRRGGPRGAAPQSGDVPESPLVVWVCTSIHSSTWYEQAGTRSSFPLTSTIHRRHAPVGVNPSMLHKVGTEIPERLRPEEPFPLLPLQFRGCLL
jgi:hypothetical protein